MIMLQRHACSPDWGYDHVRNCCDRICKKVFGNQLECPGHRPAWSRCPRRPIPGIWGGMYLEGIRLEHWEPPGQDQNGPAEIRSTYQGSNWNPLQCVPRKNMKEVHRHKSAWTAIKIKWSQKNDDAYEKGNRVGSKGNRFKNKSGWVGAGGRAHPPQCVPRKHVGRGLDGYQWRWNYPK